MLQPGSALVTFPLVLLEAQQRLLLQQKELQREEHLLQREELQQQHSNLRRSCRLQNSATSPRTARSTTHCSSSSSSEEDPIEDVEAETPQRPIRQESKGYGIDAAAGPVTVMVFLLVLIAALLVRIPRMLMQQLMLRCSWHTLCVTVGFIAAAAREAANGRPATTLQVNAASCRKLCLPKG